MASSGKTRSQFEHRALEPRVVLPTHLVHVGGEILFDLSQTQPVCVHIKNEKGTFGTRLGAPLDRRLLAVDRISQSRLSV